MVNDSKRKIEKIIVCLVLKHKLEEAFLFTVQLLGNVRKCVGTSGIAI